LLGIGEIDPNGLADQRTKQLNDGVDGGIDVEGLGLQRLPPGKCQQLLGQF
jgi:hypothetical protein